MDPKMEMMQSMMEQFFGGMDGKEISSVMKDMMPKMMEFCFSKMDTEQRTEMLSMCRNMVEEMETKHSSAEA